MLTGRAKAYSSSCPQAGTHRSTNRARRRVTSFQPKRVTDYATPPVTLQRARSVPGWVTVYEQINYLGTKPARSTQPSMLHGTVKSVLAFELSNKAMCNGVVR